jgi:crotonyl-CoA reductase
MDDVGQAAYAVHRNLRQGTARVLTLAPTGGLRVKDAAKGWKHLAAINRSRDI